MPVCNVRLSQFCNHIKYTVLQKEMSIFLGTCLLFYIEFSDSSSNNLKLLNCEIYKLSTLTHNHELYSTYIKANNGRIVQNAPYIVMLQSIGFKWSFKPSYTYMLRFKNLFTRQQEGTFNEISTITFIRMSFYFRNWREILFWKTWEIKKCPLLMYLLAPSSILRMNS